MTLDPTSLCQIEIQTPDLEKSLVFYQKVFLWKKASIDLYNYVVLEVPDNCKFGISLIPNKKAPVPNSVVLYFAVTDAKIFAERAEAWGGKVTSPRVLPGYGKVTLIEDPNGQKFGLFETQTP
jgi:predicted enzyme related to lactoylglutathione lyase